MYTESVHSRRLSAWRTLNTPLSINLIATMCQTLLQNSVMASFHCSIVKTMNSTCLPSVLPHSVWLCILISLHCRRSWEVLTKEIIPGSVITQAHHTQAIIVTEPCHNKLEMIFLLCSLPPWRSLCFSFLWICCLYVYFLLQFCPDQDLDPGEVSVALGKVCLRF